MKNLALVGAGYWGKNLARNFHALGALHTLCDASDKTLDSYGSEYEGILKTKDVNGVLKDPAISRVAIAAPAALHYDLVKRALEAGKDVFVEKPICLDIEQGRELITLAKTKGLILMVGHLLQYHPCIRAIQELLAKGDLGKLQYITSNRLNLGKIRKEENALWSFAPHDISVLLSLVQGQLPKSVICTGHASLTPGVADTTLTSLDFGDVKAHVYVSWLNPFKEQKLTVVGSHGMMVFDDTKNWKEKLVIYRNHLTWSEGAIPTPKKDNGEPLIVPESEPLRDECNHFLDCCERRIPARTDGEEGLGVLQVLDAAQQSLNKNGEAASPADISFLAFKVSDFFTHPTAFVDPKAAVGKGTKIWHFSHIMAGAELGEKCNIGQNVVVSPGVKLGRNVKVQNNVSIYTGVVCEDDVFLGPSMVFTNINNPRSAVVRRDQYVETTIRTGASIGANSTIVCGNELGAYCFIGAGAVVTKPVKPYALVVGNPARQIGWMSRHGEKLEMPLLGDGEAICPATGEKYELRDGICRFSE
jgi:UDP-2-acetamido-3-amino-2,3-dideoxy-glucuronate N-acetyltransferase